MKNFSVRLARNYRKQKTKRCHFVLRRDSMYVIGAAFFFKDVEKAQKRIAAEKLEAGVLALLTIL